MGSSCTKDSAKEPQKSAGNIDTTTRSDEKDGVLVQQNDGDVQKKSEDGDNVGEGGKGNEDGNDDQPKEHAAGN
ncbi:hydrophilic acylated surface protein a [Leishmania major strain Friedlin]|uniref:HASPA1 n=1 Tax=Leishmania major TaxID=5664 RepID=P90552_LEIMA|nr:hydrophilic acylated surface protein a [Leishmania major strain Friedlin]XP_001683441.1 hydrophilic acylated surface protein a [Leishmania major strain Friedlin]XP_001683445.1 hydrophilic acylated surface protein a [Leishmania major strain Friedlin]CAB05670.1 hydrophilic surface protein 2 [Leishmania major]CAB39973.1 HASPA1 [Leishmania major]CAG9574304.1 hydrophilic_acylated_surface_protein_a [Leishmania major strain Friedlin]CAG9574316.1 hydrophilic_acylated_surface_protein_a [Leishmania |eukprot:XP_001683439.1 hydrophilic acylated surface protein a [Leishmania major strain Friedlin]